ncbi:two-component regulator propeller domain-containing protein [Ravibacter arvi]|uniref:histidine kinase n=1 Tax=Ravibacter arvi TaxID=2051041 RepID=A0ABP8LQF7_9BACT
MVKKLFLAFLHFLACIPCTSQEFIFRHLRSGDGLSNNIVYAIAQDTTGYMWFGTTQGLNQFDSKQFRVFLYDESDTTSVSSSYINSILSDTKGTIWVATPSGLNIYNPKTDKFRRILKNSSPESICDDAVIRLYEDRKGRVWAGTKKGISMLLSKEKGTFRSYLNSDAAGTPGIREVWAIHEDEDGALWIGCRNGLIRMSFEGDQPIYEEFPSADQQTGGLHDLHITTITADRDKNIWVGTKKGGLHRWDRQKKQFIHYPASEIPGKGPASNDIRELLLTHDGSLWIGTFDGISILNTPSSEFTSIRQNLLNPASLGNNSVYGLFQDKTHSIWVGTYHKGISVVHDLVMPFHKIKADKPGQGLNSDVVSAVLEDSQQHLWIGTQGGGVNRYDPASGKYQYFTTQNGTLASNHISGILEDAAGYIWISTYRGGLSRLDPKTGRVKAYRNNPADSSSLSSDNISILIKDKRGRIWAATESDGINLFDPVDDRFYHINEHSTLFPLGNRYVRSLFADSAGNIWIGHVKGMQVFDANGKLINTLPLKLVQVIYEDSKKRMWFGNRMNSGLNRYDPGAKTIRSYSSETGLSNNNIAGIAEDDSGLLWLGTENGLSCLDPESGAVRNYNTVDGITSNVFKARAAFRNGSGQLFFGTDEGIVYFRPDEVKVNRNGPASVFTSLKLNNKPVFPGDSSQLLSVPVNETSTLTFSHFQNIFTLDFTGLSYNKPEKNQYAYRLEGLEKHWNFVPVPSATYTNLAEGDYTLWIKTANSDGVWGKPEGMRISVLPPWWRTWWAYTLYALTLFAATFFIIRFFWLRTLLRYEHALYQAKLDFFTNITHEVRTHIMLILGPIDLVLNRDYDRSAVHSRLISVKSNGERLLRLVNELLDFRKAEVSALFLQVRENELVTFLRDIFNSFSHLSEAHRITSEFISDENTIRVPFDPEQFEKVIFNLLVNAYKFTPEGGKITLSVALLDEWVKIQVTDTGKGIAPDNLGKLFVNFFQVNELGEKNTGTGLGLALSKKIVDQHGGTLTVKSRAAAGGQPGETVFTIRLRRVNPAPKKA